MTSRSYFGKMNSTLGSVVPLAMFYILSGKEIFSFGLQGDSGQVVKAKQAWGLILPKLLGKE